MRWVTGAAFWLKDRPEVREHLHVIISDHTKDPVHHVLANFTSWITERNRQCLVKASEYEALDHDSYIAYQHTRIKTSSDLDGYLSSSRLIMAPPCPNPIVRRIREGAFASTVIPLGPYRFLQAQGVFGA